MPIDPSIAMGVRPLEVGNPLNQLALASQIQASQRQGEVAQMQLEQLQQDRVEMQKLQQDLMAKGGNPDLRALATTLLKSPKHVTQGVELLQKLDEQDRYEATLKKLNRQPGAIAPAAAPMAPAQPGALGSGTFGVMPAPAAAPTNALAPAAAPSNALINQPNSPQQLEADISALMPFANRPGVQARIAGLQAQLTELRKPIVGSPGSTIYNAAGNVIANVPAQPTELMRNYEYAKREGYKGSIFDYEREMKMAGRTPAQPVAPSITQIVDPTDPNKMITVDARRYQGGGAGAPGVIGVAGKEPSAALRTNKIEEGKTQLQDDLDNLRASFNRLNDMAALPSTQRGTLSNIMSATQGSTVGQMLGRAGGTEAQVERDVISSAKQRLLTAIKNATGMSAQQLNSNMELQAMLRSLSDVSLGYEASMRIIDDIEDAYVKGAGMKKKNAAPAATPPAAGGASGKWEVVR